MNDIGHKRIILLGFLSGALGCGQEDGEISLPAPLTFTGEVIVPDGLLETNTSTTYVQGAIIVAPGTEPIVAACTTRMSTINFRVSDTYGADTIDYTHPTARVVVLRASRSVEEMAIDETAGRPGMLAGDFWGIGPETPTIPCLTPKNGICIYNGVFEQAVTLEIFPGCPPGVGPTPR